MKTLLFTRSAMAVFAAMLTAISTLTAVEIPDNGSGTADMPLATQYLALSQMHIIDGLPPGTQININALLTAPTATIEVAGGSLGGTMSGAALLFCWELEGTGALLGFNRSILLPITGVLSFPGLPTAGIEVHTAPRTPGAPVQSFDTDLFRLFVQIANPGSGDPDFDLLRVVAGTDFGLPSPGHTTLTQSGPNWAVDSFFDITYRIDFVGRPGSVLAGRSGSTTATVRVAAVPEPASAVLLAVGALGLVLRRRRLL
jgi:hypothetical protein